MLFGHIKIFLEPLCPKATILYFCGAQVLILSPKQIINIIVSICTLSCSPIDFIISINPESKITFKRKDRFLV